MPDELRFPGWDVVEQLGQGGMCMVYRVRPAEGVGPERAVKVLTEQSDDARERFAAEAELLQQLDHPNVLKVHALHSGPPPWIVMDLLGGRDLEETRIERGPMEPERAAALFADLADGLAAVHARGVRHRDLKPANIMLGHDGIPRLIDFGIARRTSQVHVTSEGYVVGTASYFPPEIFEDSDPSAVQDTEVADVFGLAQTLCEVLSGQAVHVRSSGPASVALVEIMRDKLERPSLDPREWNPLVPDGLAEVVMRATARSPRDRVPTARQLARELRSWLGRRAGGLKAPVSRAGPRGLPAPPATPRPSPQRLPTPAATGGAVGVAGGAAVSAAGLTFVGASLLLGTALGVGALWLYAPPPVEPDERGERVLRRAVDRVDLSACAEETGEAVAHWRIVDRRASDVSVRGVNASCIERVVKRARFPGVTDGLSVTLPMRFE